MSNLLLSDERFRRNVISKYLYYKKNPVLAAAEILQVDLNEAQRIALREIFTSSFMITSASRGVGKTYLAAVEALLIAILIPRSRILLIGPTFRSSKIIFLEMERIINNSPRAQIWLQKYSRQSDIWLANFYTGSIVAAMPLAAESESSIRGFRAHAILADEAPHIPADTFNMVLLPMLATYRDPMANVRRISKMKKLIDSGKMKPEEAANQMERNKFFGFTSAYFKFNHIFEKITQFEEMRDRAIREGRKPIASTFYYTYQDAPEGFLDLQQVEVARGAMPDFQFRMEWLSEWQADSNGFYPRKLIDGCIGDGRNFYFPELKGDRKSPYFMGIDPARTNDNFAISIAKEENGRFKVVRVIAFQNKKIDDFVLREVRQLFRDYPNIIRIYMDNGGGGLYFKDLLASRSFLGSEELPVLDMDDADIPNGARGKKILKMIPFSPTIATDFNFSLRAEMENKRVLLPGAAPEGSIYIKPEARDSDIKELLMIEIFKLCKEMQSIQVSVTSSSRNLKFDGPKKNSETDRFTSLLLCFAGYRDTLIKPSNVSEMAEGGWISDIVGDEQEERLGAPLIGGELKESEGIVLGADGEEISIGG